MTSLQASFEGQLIDARSPEYDAARRVFNGLVDRRPRLIARCAGPDDVSAALAFARREGLEIAVRGGGHSVAGFSAIDGGVVIDLSRLRSVDVDVPGRVARIGGGATWRDVDVKTQAQGLATPGGVVSHTGVAGLTLNGGIGWLRNRWGLSCDNLVGAQAVTAAGDRIRVDARSHPELLWALRGGGGNFAVVTTFEMTLHPLGPDVAAVFAMYDLDRSADILRRWRGWVEQSPDEVTSEVVLWTMPDWPEVAEPVRGRPVVIPSAVFAGEAATGQGVLDELRHYGQRRHEIAGIMPFIDVQTAFDAFMPNDGTVMAYWKSLFLDELSDAAIDAIAELSHRRSTPRTMLFIQHLGRGVRAVPRDATAFYPRDARYVVNLTGMWADAADSEIHRAWVRDAWHRLAPLSTRAPYLNYLGAEAPAEASTLVRAAFGDNFERLQRVKGEYDPHNIFHYNQNIPPPEG